MFKGGFKDMKIIFIILFLICAIKTYSRWSYKEWGKRCEINAQHPDFIPYSGVKHVEFDTDYDSKWDIICGIGVFVFGLLTIYSIVVS